MWTKGFQFVWGTEAVLAALGFHNMPHFLSSAGPKPTDSVSTEAFPGL